MNYYLNIKTSLLNKYPNIEFLAKGSSRAVKYSSMLVKRYDQLNQDIFNKIYDNLEIDLTDIINLIKAIVNNKGNYLKVKDKSLKISNKIHILNKLQTSNEPKWIIFQ